MHPCNQFSHSFINSNQTAYLYVCIYIHIFISKKNSLFFNSWSIHSLLGGGKDFHFWLHWNHPIHCPMSMAIFQILILQGFQKEDASCLNVSLWVDDDDFLGETLYIQTYIRFSTLWVSLICFSGCLYWPNHKIVILFQHIPVQQ